MEPVSDEGFSLKLADQYYKVLDEFWEDMAMQCQDCSPIEVWELVDGYGLLGFREWLGEMSAVSREFLAVYNSLPFFMERGFRSVAEIYEFLDGMKEAGDDAGSV